MIGLDTNVLIRYFVKDDPKQTRSVTSFINGLSSEPVWLGQVVIAELVWALASTYRMNREAVIRILDTLLAGRNIVVEQGDTVREALTLFRIGKADFADCLIAASARAGGCSKAVTLDRVAARDAGMELLA
jgi:predicted nucleic-acid-binding protein